MSQLMANERNSSCSSHTYLLEQADLNDAFKQLHIRDEGVVQLSCLLGARLKSVGRLHRKVYICQREEGSGYDICRNI